MSFYILGNARRIRWAKALIEATAIGASWLLVTAFASEHSAGIADRESCRRLFGPVLLLRLAAQFAITRSRLQWRCAGLCNLRYTVAAVSVGSVVIAAYAWLFGLLPLVIWLLPLEWLLTLNLLVATQLAARIAWRTFRGRRLAAPHRRRRVLVLGAGDAGQRVVRSLREDPASPLEPVAFLDDDESTWGRLVHGVPVLGPICDASAVLKTHPCEQVLIAIPSLPADGLRAIVRRCAGVDAELTMLPRLDHLVATNPLQRIIRKVNLADLLERAPADMNVEAIARYTSGQRVLVTGGGGSIGSELCRQLAAMKPSQLGLLGHGENSLFWIERELREDFGCEPLTFVADIQDRVRLDAVLRHFRPAVIFHAAAHKHVPLMEQNPVEAVKNNILGTRNLAELAIHHNVQVFVMISTDKAVNPTSVMGATKRVAEMVVQCLGQEVQDAADMDAPLRDLGFAPAPTGGTRFATVRFGNVLGSRGSVVPVMQRQIEAGGPVTVTHPDMERYFMTVPEAAQLVLEAGARARAGEIYILDMGRPVRVLDLAENLIRLCGLIPGRDIEIRFTGVRPGEKLREEVLTAEEGLASTWHERILVACPDVVNRQALSDILFELERAAQQGDDEAVLALLRKAVPTFHSPESESLDFACPQPARDVRRAPILSTP
jgi:FlaA1/EpsC-like NDP-sugar epimerase